MCDRLLLGPTACICNGKRGVGNGRVLFPSSSSDHCTNTPEPGKKKADHKNPHFPHTHHKEKRLSIICVWNIFCSRLFEIPLHKEKEERTLQYLLSYLKEPQLAPPIPSIAHQKPFLLISLTKRRRNLGFCSTSFVRPCLATPTSFLLHLHSTRFPIFSLFRI